MGSSELWHKDEGISPILTPGVISDSQNIYYVIKECMSLPPSHLRNKFS